jgi:hypothetical protein
MISGLMGILLVLGAGNDPAAAQARDQVRLDWRAAARCGPNCLYVMLFMFGKRPDYATLIANMEMTDRGASVAELVRVADRFGLHLKAVRADAGALSSTLPMPAIVHFQEAGNDGHFVLLLRANGDDTFTVLEATRGEIRRMLRGDLYDIWTGVAIVESRAWDDAWWTRLVGPSSSVAAAVAVAACAVIWRSLNRRKEVSR